MLTNRAIQYLKPLVYKNDAKRCVCTLPLGGIYWQGEIPDFEALMNMPEEDRLGIFSLFRIRFLIWNDDELSQRDKSIWETALRQVPGYALFTRLKLSDEDRQTQEEIERDAEKVIEALSADADDAKISEKNGFQSFSLSFDLTKKPETAAPLRSWWRRLFRL